MSVSEARLRGLLVPGAVPKRVDAGRMRPAAVLVPLEPERGVWLTRRAINLPTHAGQVSFPGGRIEPDDASAEAAALREAEEETGLDPAQVEVLGRMDDFTTATGFHIVPVLGLVPHGVVWRPAPAEVAEVFCLPFEALLDETLPHERQALYRGRVSPFLVWPHEDHIIWGATARILAELGARLRAGA